MTGSTGEVVDWADAAGLAGRLVHPGPTASRQELEDLVGSLRSAADRAVEPILSLTGLRPADGRDLATHPLSRVQVVDRAGWAQAGAASMAAMTQGALTAQGRRLPLAAEVTATAEVGAVLGLLSTKILGQFDPYSSSPGAVASPGSTGSPATPGALDTPGTLLLVAPNVLQVERAMKVRAADFRLWVCLHEQTHALQFAAAPWLTEHLLGRTQALLRGIEPSGGAAASLRQSAARVTSLVRAVHDALRGRPGGSLVDGLLTPEQRVAFDELTGIMSLLEGHADVSMDGVGRAVVPTVRTIRAKFDARRDGAGGSVGAGIAKRLLGMEAKLDQYRSGAAFVRAVTLEVGTEGFNAVWTSPTTLPSAREIADPIAWVRRVHG